MERVKVRMTLIEQAMDTGLSPRNQSILWAYFGLAGKPHTMDDIAQAWSISRERVSQLVQSAARRLDRHQVAFPRGGTWTAAVGVLARERKKRGGRRRGPLPPLEHAS